MGVIVMQHGCGGGASRAVALAVLLATGAGGVRYEEDDAAGAGPEIGLEAGASGQGGVGAGGGGTASVLKAGANASDPDTNVTDQLRWGCDKIAEEPINSAVTYCFAISAIASHCFPVIHYAGGKKAAMLELNGARGTTKAALGCYDLGSRWYKSALLKKKSRMKTSDTGMCWLQQPEKAAAKCIGGWKDQGYTGACYKDTMAGVKQWVIDYLSKFPDYEGVTTNCQKFSVGLYNAVTHSHESERQRTGMKILEYLGGAVQASAESLESLSGEKAKEQEGQGTA